MKYFKAKGEPEFIVCKSERSGAVVGIIGQVGMLLDRDIIIPEDGCKINREAWLFVERLDGSCSPECETKRDAKAYCERIYK